MAGSRSGWGPGASMTDAPPPVFILAPPLGLGGHLAACLDRHPGFAGLPATQLYCGETLREMERAWGPRLPRPRSGLIRALALHRFGGEDQAQAASDWLDGQADAPAAAIMAALAKAAAPRRLVDASFLYPVDASALDRIARAHPDARFIHLMRHPALIWRDPDRAADRVERLWLRPHLAIHAFLAERDPLSWLRLRVEWLAEDPAPRLDAVLDWLGAERGDDALAAMLDPDLHAAFARPGPAEAPHGVDPALIADPGLDQLLLAPSAPVLDQAAWEAAGFDEETRVMARLFGYA